MAFPLAVVVTRPLTTENLIAFGTKNVASQARKLFRFGGPVGVPVAGTGQNKKKRPRPAAIPHRFARDRMLAEPSVVSLRRATGNPN
jgi:hypothetical protein